MPSDKRNLFSHSSGGRESETGVGRLIDSDGTEGKSVPGLSGRFWCGLQHVDLSAL